MKKTYRVFFDQVNQSCYTVVAANAEEATRIGAKMWKEENGRPTGAHVEDETGNEVDE